jgi:hypothetical protein
MIMPQMPQDEGFQSDNVLNEVELELICWEKRVCTAYRVLNFGLTIYEYASPALKVELRKHFQIDQNKTEKVKQIVRTEKWVVSRRFAFVRKDIRMMLRREFRRQRMGTVIAELRLLRRQQSERHFPATIFNRSAMIIS